MLQLFPLQGYAHGITEAARQSMIDGGLFSYVQLGATHMLTGYDHLLFIFGVIFFLKKFTDILKFISLFTLGHSVTLIFATFAGIQADAYLIDAVIALTVIYKGFENLDGFNKYLKFQAPNLLTMVFLFGLIHGFGLSTRLQELPLEFESWSLFTHIIAFNVGVELGQVLALAAMTSIVIAWKKRPSFAHFSRISNIGLIFIGFMLFMMQLHGYNHNNSPDDFGFSKDNHDHAHDVREVEEAFQQNYNRGHQEHLHDPKDKGHQH